MGDFDSKVLSLLKSRNRPMSLRSIINYYGDDLDITEDDLEILLESCSSVIVVSGTYRYHNPSPNEYRDICDIIRSSLDSQFIDVRDEYSKHKDEYKHLDVRSHFELASLLKRYFPDSTTTMGLSFKSDVIQHSIGIHAAGSAGNVLDRALLQTILAGHSGEYVSLDEIFNEYRGYNNSRKLTKSEVESVLVEMPSVLKTHGLYRLFTIDAESLRRLMSNAADSIPFDRADCGQAYHAVIVEAKSLGIKNSDELNQLLVSAFPESLSTIVGEIKLSYFRDSESEVAASEDAYERQEKTVEKSDDNSILFSGVETTNHASKEIDDFSDSDNHGEIASTHNLSGGCFDKTDEIDLSMEARINRDEAVAEDQAPTLETIDLVKSVLDGVGYVSISYILRKIEKTNNHITSQCLESVISYLESDNLLYSHGKAYRLHRPIEHHLLADVLKRYHKSIYSVFQIFSENERNLRDMDITGWDELSQCLVNYDEVEMIGGSMPLISFDGMTVEEQINNLLELDPELDNRQILRHMYSKYGIPTRIVKTVLGSMPDRLDQNRQSTSDLPNSESVSSSLFDDYSVEILRGSLNQSCYTSEEFIETLSSTLNQKFTKDDICDERIKQLGYRTRSSYVFRADYKTPHEAIKSMFSGKEIISLNEYQSKSRLVNQVIGEMLGSYDILRFGDDRYIPVSRLEPLGIRKSDVSTFPMSVANSMQFRTFTVRYIRGSNICGAIDNPALDDDFLQSLLVSSNLFSCREMDGVMLMNAKRTPTLGDILKDIVSREGSMDLDDIQYILKDDYGLNKDEKSIKRSLSSTDMIYLEQIDKVFRNNAEMRRFLNDQSDGLSR